MLENLVWSFPLETPHRGVPCANGRLGLLVYGAENILKITLARADLWDHRGGMPWTEKQNYRDIKRSLETYDETGLAEIFATSTEKIPNQPPRPSVIPFGRYEIDFGKGSMLEKASLSFSDGTVTVYFTTPDGLTESFTLDFSMSSDRFMMTFENDFDVSIKFVSSYSIVPDFARYSFEEPLISDNTIIQKMPCDEHIGTSFKCLPSRILFNVARAAETDDLARILNDFNDETFEYECCVSSKKFMRDFFESIPKINVPSEIVERNYYFGLYKFKCFSNAPYGVPGTLQGPWIEEHRMPPWSSDYHFNINVQMCYSPALAAGLYDDIKAIFDLVLSWKDTLRKNAEMFIGTSRGYMLPHAVDDKCMCMGSFWTGTIDHACTAWMSFMMFDYVMYSDDKKFLADEVFDFMCGVFNVYYAMLEESEDGKFVLPLSVSPEYKGCEITAWGQNASFQLAAIHRLARNLTTACDMLGLEHDLRWNDVKKRLPVASFIKDAGTGKDIIALWAGQALDESHRHHSHLAGITPFNIFDTTDPFWRQLISDSITYSWYPHGMNLWTAWSFPWAASINSHIGNADAAVKLIELWDGFFINKGYGSIYESQVPGFTMNFASPFDPEISKRNAYGTPHEIMQLDSAFGTVNAIQELFVHNRSDVLHIAPGIPEIWHDISFSNFRTSCGVTISCTISKNIITSLMLHAIRDVAFEMEYRGKRITVSMNKNESRDFADVLKNTGESL